MRQKGLVLVQPHPRAFAVLRRRSAHLGEAPETEARGADRARKALARRSGSQTPKTWALSMGWAELCKKVVGQLTNLDQIVGQWAGHHVSTNLLHLHVVGISANVCSRFLQVP